MVSFILIHKCNISDFFQDPGHKKARLSYLTSLKHRTYEIWERLQVLDTEGRHHK